VFTSTSLDEVNIKNASEEDDDDHYTSISSKNNLAKGSQYHQFDFNLNSFLFK
jgi:hypothetical protein